MNIFSKFLYKNYFSPKYSRIFASNNGINKFKSIYEAINNRKYYSSLKLNRLLTEAEEIIRVPLSNFNVKHLLRDEFDIKVFTINKINTKYISESNHPIVDIARHIFGSNDCENSITNNNKFSDSTGTLILLLIAKVSESLPSFKSDETIVKKQYNFAEIYEMINKALIIHHEAVVNIPTSGSTVVRPDVKRLNDANKISILGGDYLLSYAIVRLANLVNNTTILQLIMCAIDDYCSYHFNNVRDSDGLTIPSNNMSVHDWEEMAGYSLTKLIAYCSQIMVLLAKQSDRYQKAAFDLGYNLQLVWNLKDEMESFREFNSSYDASPLKLMSAPVIFHMQSDPEFINYLKSCSSSPQDLDFAKIRQSVIEGPAIDKCNRYLDFYTNKAIKSLDIFPDSRAKSILKNAIIA